MKRMTLIFTALLVIFLLTTGVFSSFVMAYQIEWTEWQNVPNSQGAMFLDNLGDWRWSGSKYTAYHDPGKTSVGNYNSWTDFGTGLGEELTNYKVKFKTTRPPDGQGTPGFVIAAQKVDANTFGEAPYQAIAKGFGFPIWYFGDWVGRPGGNTVEWDAVGNPAVGAELIFEIMVTPDKFTFSVNGYVIENLNNPPNGGKGYFGLGGQDIQLSPSAGVVFENIQYALPYVAPAATPTSSANPTSSATPTNDPVPTGQATVTPAPTGATPAEQASDSSSVDTSLDSSESDTSQDSDISESDESQSGDVSNSGTPDSDSDIETSPDLASEDSDIDADKVGNLSVVYLISSILVLVIGCTAVYFILKKKGILNKSRVNDEK